MLNRKEIKIFLTFFLIYSFFVYWIGWNEQSHFALTRSIVDEGRLEIDSYANQTSDRAFFNGHYFSDKDPGPSFLAVPVYGTWKFIYNFFPENFKKVYAGGNEYLKTEVGLNKTLVYNYINPGFFTLISMILITIFTSSLFSALTIILIYKISRYLTENENYRLMLIIIAGLGTLIFPYALVFMKHATATFFSFLSFYLLFKAKQEKIKDNKYFILSGILLGFAMTCDITTFIIGIFDFFYLISFKKEKIFIFIFSGFIGILPFFLYNYLAFENPFTLPRHYMDPTIWPELGGIKGLKTPDLFIFLRLLFYPERGLLFYYPILFFSLIGLCLMYKKFKIESIGILFIFIAFLIMNSSWWAWWGGTSFGPRHLTPLTPFLVISLVYIFPKLDKSKTLKYLVFILIFYSIFVNILGLQVLTDDFVSNNLITISKDYEQKISSFSVIKNPLYDHYLPLFLNDGPKNRVFENLVNNDILIDARHSPISKEMFYPFVRAYLPFMSAISVLLIFIFIIWRRQIENKEHEKIVPFLLTLIVCQIYFARPYIEFFLPIILISLGFLVFYLYKISRKLKFNKNEIFNFLFYYFLIILIEFLILSLINKTFYFSEYLEFLNAIDLLPISTIVQSLPILLVPFILSLFFIKKIKFSILGAVILIFIIIIFLDMLVYRPYEVQWHAWESKGWKSPHPYEGMFPQGANLLIYKDGCEYPIWVEREINIPLFIKSIEIEGCAGEAGGDGTKAYLYIDDVENTMFVFSNTCKEFSFDIKKFVDNDIHKIKIEPDIFGICSEEGFIIKSIKLK